jgi:serine-type D-Ala-D-Ala carboxypeptidase/endopeptidase (penicillin-binding protein 4)
MHRTGLFTTAVLLLFGGCAPRASAPVTSTPRPSLAAVIDSLTGQPPLHRTSWGIALADAATGAVLYEQNADRLFIPASNTKFVVSLTALGTLGPDYRYRTPLLAAGWAGDTASRVIVRGRGDPTWSARVHGNVAVAIDSMAALVAASGLRRIGVLISDASFFQDELVNGTWEVGDLPFQYAPPIDAVAAGEGVFRLVAVGAAAPGQPAEVEVLGALPQPVRAVVGTDTAGAPRSLRVDYTLRRDTVHLSGLVGAGAADTLTLALTEPARSLIEGLAEALRSRGVAVDSTAVIRDTAEAVRLAAGSRQVAEWVSPPMGDIVAIIMQPSQNWVAEQVLKTLGAERGDGGTWRDGIAVERAWLHGVVGIDSSAANLRDASGMSVQNLLTPRAILEMLRYARAQTWSDTFRASLAAPGLRGSTLNSRLPALQGRLAGKTGSLSNVNSLAGYVTDISGREYVFAVLSNGSGQPSATVRSAIDEIVLALVRHIDNER